jgi:hypothetical protein
VVTLPLLGVAGLCLGLRWVVRWRLTRRLTLALLAAAGGLYVAAVLALLLGGADGADRCWTCTPHGVTAALLAGCIALCAVATAVGRVRSD